MGEKEQSVEREKKFEMIFFEEGANLYSPHMSTQRNPLGALMTNDLMVLVQGSPC